MASPKTRKRSNETGGSPAPETPKPVPSASPTTADKTDIDKKYNAKLASLKFECKAESGKLVDAILSVWTDGDPETLKGLQAKFLLQAMSAEAACDAKFQALLTQAKAEYTDAGLSHTSMPAWESTYQKEKAAARTAAINKLAQSIRQSEGDKSE